MGLKEAREKIDNIDEKIQELLDERMEAVREVAVSKAMSGADIFDPKREEEKLFKLSHKGVFQAIMDESKEYQRERIERTPLYGLLGRKLGHSISSELHKQIAGYDYAHFEVEADELESFFKNCKFKAINVTIPYKKEAMKYCDELSEEARKAGSVNVIKRESDGRLVGYNTDIFGFKKLFEEVQESDKLQSHTISKAVILGKGGAAVGIRQALIEMGVSPEKIAMLGRNEMNEYEETDLLINATPVGMFPDNDEMPVNELRCKALIDVIYNPIKSRLVLEAEKMNIPALGGLKMFFYQAVKSAEIFLGTEFDKKEMAIKYEQFKSWYENIALIGMPGCGKSTVGRKLAALSGRNFVDLDDEIYSREGQTSEEIILMRGEETFRRIESQVLEDVAKGHGQVIATGGGVVTVPSNYQLLRANSKIIYIKREIDELSVEERPISKQKGLDKLFEERSPLYEEWADFAIESEDEEMVAAAIKEIE